MMASSVSASQIFGMTTLRKRSRGPHHVCYCAQHHAHFGLKDVPYFRALNLLITLLYK